MEVNQINSSNFQVEEHIKRNEYFVDMEADQKYGDSKYLVVVVYDIVNDKRRNKLSKYLQSYGIRVQKSCFECILDQKLYNKLIKHLPKFISAEDLLRVYRLTGAMEVITWGTVGKLEEEDTLII